MTEHGPSGLSSQEDEAKLHRLREGVIEATTYRLRSGPPMSETDLLVLNLLSRDLKLSSYEPDARNYSGTGWPE